MHKQASADPAPISIVPRPRSLRASAGPGFSWHAVRIDAVSAAERNAASFLIAFARNRGGDASIGGPATIRIHELRHADRRLGNEGYALDVKARRISIAANGAAGLFYGVQTLEQLTTGTGPALSTRGAAVIDWPQYRWRGIELDVSRHFFDVAAIERYLDVAAHYKLNIFHWHLTDDQAWRFPVSVYPRLTQASEHYSAAQIAHIVRYAAARAMTIVPEIEMPGHSTAARRAYPQSAGFFRAVLAEVVRRFPGPYVHIGGDEVAYTADSVRLMRAAQQFLQAHGRAAIVWDDALAANLPASTIVMSWHGGAAAARALARGADVVMTPDGPLYFDAFQGQRAQEPPASAHMSTLEQVYDYEPPARVLGVQANVWTEHIRTARELAYMTLPRELALAEIAWTPPLRKDWPAFEKRLPGQFAYLDAHGYGYRIPNVIFVVNPPGVHFFPVRGNPQAARAMTDRASVEVRMESLAPGAVHYTTDGTVPQKTSPAYNRPIVLRLARSMQVRAFAVAGSGRQSAVTSCVFTRVPTAQLLSVRSSSRAFAGLVSP